MKEFIEKTIDLRCNFGFITINTNRRNIDAIPKTKELLLRCIQSCLSAFEETCKGRKYGLNNA